MGHAVRLEPDAHRVILGAKDGDVTDAFDPLQLIDDIQAGVVREEQRVVFAFFGLQRNNLQDVVRALLDDHAIAPDFFWQARFGRLDAVIARLPQPC